MIGDLGCRKRLQVQQELLCAAVTQMLAEGRGVPCELIATLSPEFLAALNLPQPRPPLGSTGLDRLQREKSVLQQQSPLSSRDSPSNANATPTLFSAMRQTLNNGLKRERSTYGGGLAPELTKVQSEALVKNLRRVLHGTEFEALARADNANAYDVETTSIFAIL